MMTKTEYPLIKKYGKDLSAYLAPLMVEWDEKAIEVMIRRAIDDCAKVAEEHVRTLALAGDFHGQEVAKAICKLKEEKAR